MDVLGAATELAARAGLRALEISKEGELVSGLSTERAAASYIRHSEARGLKQDHTAGRDGHGRYTDRRK